MSEFLPLARGVGTVAAALRLTRQALGAAGIETAGLEARLFVGRAAGLTAGETIAADDRDFPAGAHPLLLQMLQRRLAGEPVAYILGEKEFWSLSFVVSNVTLIPRPDSETLIEAALRRVRPQAPLRILDLGTGSGCLLLALLHELPSSSGIGVDISEAALAVARRNAAKLHLADRAGFVCGNWAAALAGGFDLILANPPYLAAADWSELAAEVAIYEPKLALAGGTDGLDAYRLILPQALARLRKEGTGLFEVGAGQASAVAALARRVGFHGVEIERDLSGNERCVVAYLDAFQPTKKALGNQAVPV